MSLSEVISDLVESLCDFSLLLAKDEAVESASDLKDNVDKILNKMKVICYGDANNIVDECAVAELSSNIQKVFVFTIDQVL